MCSKVGIYFLIILIMSDLEDDGLSKILLKSSLILSNDILISSQLIYPKDLKSFSI